MVLWIRKVATGAWRSRGGGGRWEEGRDDSKGKMRHVLVSQWSSIPFYSNAVAYFIVLLFSCLGHLSCCTTPTHALDDSDIWLYYIGWMCAYAAINSLTITPLVMSCIKHSRVLRDMLRCCPAWESRDLRWFTPTCSLLFSWSQHPYYLALLLPLSFVLSTTLIDDGKLRKVR